MKCLPHINIIVAFCIAAIGGYAILSGWAVFFSDDAGQRGDVIGTWKSFAVAAFAFWLGSSSGGKAQAEQATGKPSDPVNIKEAEH